jgi:hypothetical protein
LKQNRRNKRRHKVGFGYVAHGNTHAIFSRKPRVVFSEIKHKLNLQSQKEFHKNFNDKELSNSERSRIKNRVREYEKQRMIKIVIVFIAASLIIYLLLKYLIQNFTF